MLKVWTKRHACSSKHSLVTKLFNEKQEWFHIARHCNKMQKASKCLNVVVAEKNSNLDGELEGLLGIAGDWAGARLQGRHVGPGRVQPQLVQVMLKHPKQRER